MASKNRSEGGFQPAHCLKFIPESPHFDSIIASMERYGYLPAYPIVLFNNEILLGRARFQACLVTQTEPVMREYAGECDNNPEFFALTDNFQRLTQRQREMIGVRLSKLIARRTSVHEVARRVNHLRPLTIANDLGIPYMRVWHLRSVLRRGTPKLVRAVEEGRMNPETAYRMLKLTKEQQDAVVDGIVGFLRRGNGERRSHDANGTPIPVELFETFAALGLRSVSRRLIASAKILTSGQSSNPYIKPAWIQTLVDLEQEIMTAIPHTLCACGGLGCETCRNLGWLPAPSPTHEAPDHSSPPSLPSEPDREG